MNALKIKQCSFQFHFCTHTPFLLQFVLSPSLCSFAHPTPLFSFTKPLDKELGHCPMCIHCSPEKLFHNRAFFQQENVIIVSNYLASCPLDDLCICCCCWISVMINIQESLCQNIASKLNLIVSIELCIHQFQGQA